MFNDLVSPFDLDGYPGGPFEPSLVDNAVAQVRARAGWHIAPVRADTLTVQVFGGSRWLFLPTRRLVTVTAVRRNGVPVTSGYSTTPGGMLYAASWRGWEWGTYEVDVTHGYPECPPELVGLVASLAGSMATAQSSDVSRVTVGAVSTEYRDTSTGGSPAATILGDEALARYALPAGLA